jgi:hypothetical protein
MAVGAVVSEAAGARRPIPPKTERRDTWWVEPLIVVLVLGGFVVYATWAALQNAHYYAAPYLSPFYSPCLATNCEHRTLPFAIPWIVTPAMLVLWIPGGFRLTCYYYRKAYYRSFFRLPPACAVPDAASSYSGESRFPFLLQNIHRYFFWLSLLILAFLWWDALLAFRFPNGFGVGLGTLVLLANVVLLSLYSFSCHSCRYFAGGHLDAFFKAPIRFRLWQLTNRLNLRHGLFAWISLWSVALTDLYVRLVSMGVIRDLRFL